MGFWRSEDGSSSKVSDSDTASSDSVERKESTDIGQGRLSLDELESRSQGSVEEKSASPLKPRQTKTNETDRAPASRDAEFHKLFPDIDKDEPLIASWSCALAREILVHGRLYASESHLCFYSNILFWSSELSLHYNEVLAISPRTTAGLFPNGIALETLRTRYSFASFVNRDKAIRVIKRLWRNSSGIDEDRSTTYASSISSITTTSDSQEADSSSQASFGSRMSKTSETEAEQELDAAANEKRKGSVSRNSKPPTNQSPVENLGPDSHAPTDLPEPESKEKVVGNCTSKAPLGIVANILFGKDTSYAKRLRTDLMGFKNLEEIPQFAESDGKKTRAYEYVKPLNASLGPKQTNCKTTETIEAWDMEDKVVVLSVTATPDVPSGQSFTTNTRTSLAWDEDNSTKIQVSTWVEWTGMSFIKGPIEKGAVDGQKEDAQYILDLVEEVMNGSRKKSKAKRRNTAPKRGKAQEEEEPQSSLFTNPYILMAVGALLLVAILYLFFSGRGNDRQERQRLIRSQHEAMIWEWIDERSESTWAQPDLHKYELSEAIRVTESRLRALKQKLSQQSSE